MKIRHDSNNIIHMEGSSFMLVIECDSNFRILHTSEEDANSYCRITFDNSNDIDMLINELQYLKRGLSNE